MQPKKRIALVAHDNCKADLIEWVEHNWQALSAHDLTSTGTTGTLIESAITKRSGKTPHIQKLKSGPLGGDLELGALIAQEKIDVIFFFWDPMHAQPHDVDVKALLRICVLYNVASASNRSTADFIIASPHFATAYARKAPDTQAYTHRFDKA